MVLGQKNQFVPKQNQKKTSFSEFGRIVSQICFCAFPGPKLVFLVQNRLFPRKKLVFQPKTIFSPRKNGFAIENQLFLSQEKACVSLPYSLHELLVCACVCVCVCMLGMAHVHSVQ